uniref:Uncharacterized protein n=1 Tax=Trypanosoma congolense (strain IL3000) TaxID=1068625 RepID=G0UZJ5_TRYCI|nr:conserved hypothetical protein [Trypanosoma congolense IL3000]
MPNVSDGKQPHTESTVANKGNDDSMAEVSTAGHTNVDGISSFFRFSNTSQEKTTSGCATDYMSDDLLNLAAQLKTIIPKGTWESLGSEEEINEENGYNVKKRPQVRVAFEVRRDVLLHQRQGNANYLTKEASEDSRDQRGAVNALYEVSRDEVDVGVQAVAALVTRPTQTRYSRKVDATVQAQPTLVDMCFRGAPLPPVDMSAMRSFFSKVLPRTLHCLLQNYEVPIYQDDFSLFSDDYAIMGSRDDTVLIEKGNYTHTTMKDLRVSSISWRSSRARDDVVCIASVARHSLEQRIEAEKLCETVTNLVWDFADPMHPYAVLEAPGEIQVMRFNPLRTNLIVGGAMNGQLFLWDLDKISGSSTAGKANRDAGLDASVAPRSETGSKDIPAMPVITKGLTFKRDGDVLVPHLQPCQASRMELSHRRAVHDIQWLPHGLECTFGGKQTVTHEGRQCVSISDDGYMCVWDIHPEYLPADKLRKMKHQGRVGGEDFPWVPLLRFQMSKPGGGGDVAGFRFHVDGLLASETPSYRVCCGSVHGEVAVCSILVPDERRDFSANSEDVRVVQQLFRGHAGPVYSIQRHPTISDVYMTCGDVQFKIWRVGLEFPILTSPQHDTAITCARWSPTRVSVLFVGTSDGKILVWDLLDRNSEPLLVHQLVQDAITYINFKPAPTSLPANYVQYVAIGTSVGSFHLYTLPKVLSRGPSGEQRHFRMVLEREVRRVLFFRWRWAERSRERDRYGHAPPKILGREKEIAVGTGADEKTAAVDDDYYDYDHHRDAEFLKKVEAFKPEEDTMSLSDLDASGTDPRLKPVE